MSDEATTPKRFMTRLEILEARDFVTEDLEVPEWGTWVTVKGMTARERDAYEESIVTGRGKHRDIDIRDARAKLVQRTVINKEDGSLLFTKDDIDRLSLKSAKALDRIFEAAQRLSGITDEDMDELVGNSKRDRSDDSSSD